MSKAKEFLKVHETILSDIGDRFESTVKALRDAGFLTATYSKGDAFTPAQITLDNGIVISIDNDSGNLEIQPDAKYGAALHKKQRFFTPGDLIQALSGMTKVGYP
jgi:hypothetical protein